jgi:hypothetical protein
MVRNFEDVNVQKPNSSLKEVLLRWGFDVTGEKNRERRRLSSSDDGAGIGVLPCSLEKLCIRRKDGHGKISVPQNLPRARRANGDAFRTKKSDKPPKRLGGCRDFRQEHDTDLLPFEHIEKATEVILLRMGEDDDFHPSIPKRTHLAQAMQDGCIRPPVHEDVGSSAAEEYGIPLADIEYMECRCLRPSRGKRERSRAREHSEPEREHEPPRTHGTVV